MISLYFSFFLIISLLSQFFYLNFFSLYFLSYAQPIDFFVLCKYVIHLESCKIYKHTHTQKKRKNNHRHQKKSKPNQPTLYTVKQAIYHQSPVIDALM